MVTYAPHMVWLFSRAGCAFEVVFESLRDSSPFYCNNVMKNYS